MSIRPHTRFLVLAAWLLVCRTALTADNKEGAQVNTATAPASKAYSSDPKLGVPQRPTHGPVQTQTPGGGQPAAARGPDGELRGLMDKLGIQPTEHQGMKNYMQRGAPSRDRDRLPAAARVRPPDAFHAGPTVSPATVSDRTRLKQLGASFRAGAKGRMRRLRETNLGNAGLENLGYGVSPAGRFGTTGRLVGPYESQALGSGFAPSTAMQSASNFGTGWSNTVMGGGYGYGTPMGSRSSSSLLQGGSPDDFGSQAGSPSSIYTIGSGQTLSGSGAMPGGGMGIGTGAGTFGINGPMGAAGS